MSACDPNGRSGGWRSAEDKLCLRESSWSDGFDWATLLLKFQRSEGHSRTAAVAQQPADQLPTHEKAHARARTNARQHLLGYFCSDFENSCFGLFFFHTYIFFNYTECNPTLTPLSSVTDLNLLEAGGGHTNLHYWTPVRLNKIRAQTQSALETLPLRFNLLGFFCLKL